MRNSKEIREDITKLLDEMETKINVPEEEYDSLVSKQEELEDELARVEAIEKKRAAQANFLGGLPAGDGGEKRAGVCFKIIFIDLCAINNKGVNIWSLFLVAKVRVIGLHCFNGKGKINKM